jgi:hypothetical protein
MRVRVGPLPSTGVALWIAYARTVIGGALARPDELGLQLDPEVVESFEDYLDQWDRASSTGATFVWETDVEPERIVALGAAWLELADRLAGAAERRGYPMSPPEGEEFYRALITGFLDALEGEGPDYAELAADLRADWPGLKPEDPSPDPG